MLLAVVFTAGFGGYTDLILILSIQVVALPLDIQFFYQGEEDFKTIAIRTIIMRVAALACVFIFVKDEGDTWVYALCLSLATFASNLMMWPALIKRVCKVKPKDMQFRKHFLPTFIIFLPSLAVTVYSVFDKTMIGLLSANPDYDNGCYEQAYKFNSVALLLVTIVPYVLVPRNAYDYANKNEQGMKNHVYFAFRYVWMIGLPLIAGCAALAPNFCSWFLGEGYAEVPLLLCIMSVRFITSGFSVILGDSIFIVIGKEKYVMIAAFVAAGLNVGLNALMIPTLGAVGAAIATAIAEGSICIVLGIFAIAKGIISFRKVILMSWRYVLCAGIMFAALWFAQRYLPYAIWSFVAMTAAGAIVYGVLLLVLRDRFTIDLIKKSLSVFKKHKKGNEQK